MPNEGYKRPSYSALNFTELVYAGIVMPCITVTSCLKDTLLQLLRQLLTTNYILTKKIFKETIYSILKALEKAAINCMHVDQQNGDHFLLQEEENAQTAMLSCIYFNLIHFLDSPVSKSESE